MFPNMRQYMEMKYGNVPQMDVTKQELIKMLVENGSSPEDANFQANMALKLGSRIRIGDKSVGIKEG